jgi:murein L,D-transpeptidase YcbB/YkuD
MMQFIQTGAESVRRFALIVGVCAAGFFSVSAAVRADPLPDAGAIQAALQGDGALILGGRVVDRAQLQSVYEPRAFAPVWDEAHQESFLHALEEADSHGLDPAAYDVRTTRPVDRELLLSDAFLRYASALARGRVSPSSFETDWRIDSPDFDAAKIFAAAVAGDVASVLADLAPHDPAYERLRDAMRRYLQLAQKGWHSFYTPNTIRPGDHDDIVAQLRDRLGAEGYIDPAVPVDDPASYDDALAAAVSRFQVAHGLPPDGAVGRTTLAALNVSATLRVRQLRWNLERYRSLPRIDAAMRIEVNVAATTATLFEDGQPVRVMKTIVGATIHPTPVLRARMSGVLFNPPWRVPSSIIQNEIRPMLERDPNYLKRFNFVYQDVGSGKQLVQLPGPSNSLGQIKFEMPNSDDIYMHDTPERGLFALSRRYISHGCVRVEDPRGLAQVLLDSDQWPREAIDAAVATGTTRSVPLKHSLPVYVLYWTAFVDADGTVEFRDDVYGRDRRLAEALAARDATEHPAVTANNG